MPLAHFPFLLFHCSLFAQGFIASLFTTRTPSHLLPASPPFVNSTHPKPSSATHSLTECHSFRWWLSITVIPHCLNKKRLVVCSALQSEKKATTVFCLFNKSKFMILDLDLFLTRTPKNAVKAAPSDSWKLSALSLQTSVSKYTQCALVYPSSLTLNQRDKGGKRSPGSPAFSGYNIQSLLRRVCQF